MRDVFSIKMCPPLHDKAADITVTQGGEMVRQTWTVTCLGTSKFLIQTNGFVSKQPLHYNKTASIRAIAITVHILFKLFIVAVITIG